MNYSNIFAINYSVDESKIYAITDLNIAPHS